MGAPHVDDRSDNRRPLGRRPPAFAKLMQQLMVRTPNRAYVVALQFYWYDLNAPIAYEIAICDIAICTNKTSPHTSMIRSRIAMATALTLLTAPILRITE